MATLSPILLTQKLLPSWVDLLTRTKKVKQFATLDSEALPRFELIQTRNVLETPVHQHNCSELHQETCNRAMKVPVALDAAPKKQTWLDSYKENCEVLTSVNPLSAAGFTHLSFTCHTPLLKKA